MKLSVFYDHVIEAHDQTGKDVDTLKSSMTDEDKLFSFFDSRTEVKRMADAMNSAVKMGSDMSITVLFEDFDDFSSPMSGINGVAWFLRTITV